MASQCVLVTIFLEYVRANQGSILQRRTSAKKDWLISRQWMMFLEQGMSRSRMGGSLAPDRGRQEDQAVVTRWLSPITCIRCILLSSHPIKRTSDPLRLAPTHPRLHPFTDPIYLHHQRGKYGSTNCLAHVTHARRHRRCTKRIGKA